MTDIFIPAAAVGPGTQPQEPDGAELDILQLPQEMNTYVAPRLPEPEELCGREAALAILRALRDRLSDHPIEEVNPFWELDSLDDRNRELIDQVLGEGEVSMVVRQASGEVRIQEAVMAGIWRVRRLNEQGALVADRIEIGDVPACVKNEAFSGMEARLDVDERELSPGVLNAPPLIAEIRERVEELTEAMQAAHVINLTLLPQTEEDLGFLMEKLGEGRVTILSRGYGNCRITSTATPGVWWVQYFNSQDRNILNSIEITPVPEVACAAQEDLEDSAARLGEILEIYH